MLNLFQHLTKSGTYETLKRVQGDRLGLFTRPSLMVIAWFKRMIRSRLDLRTFLPDVNKNLDPRRVTDKGRFFLTD